MFLVAMLYAFVFHLIFFANIVVMDDNEEIITLPVSYFFVVAGFGICIYYYIKHIPGKRSYRKAKEIVWGIYFATTALICMMWFTLNLVGYTNELLRNQLFLLVIILVSALLTTQIAFKFKTEGSD